jgi:hypothetical protein
LALIGLTRRFREQALLLQGIAVGQLALIGLTRRFREQALLLREVAVSSGGPMPGEDGR